ncbi:hypothetical protein GXN76_13485 [Kroppenstedtia pulmonis]|uniref:GCM domain-containing protein n=1 Tax=Kroppenstedtia pulmonis TaxID=1380685 RepID=A0A7D3Y1I5_9BACL|nr:hypothetical protein [Kroppenstedtia pulmonis]QKG85380.1 hypothetical protein GXN76_13485 [Kroppenstedtia pulmonis]
MALEESSQTGDTIVKTNSLRFLVAERDQRAVDGVRIDVVSSLFGKRFHIQPPQSLPSSGC